MKKVGEIRKFTNDQRLFKIREILDNPEITLKWTWDTGICPHCKKRIIREVEHKFYRIEILGDSTKEDSELQISDITLMGDTLDNRRLILPIEKYNEVLQKSSKFKKLANIKGV